VWVVRTPEQLEHVFRERGLKVTPQRQSVFRALHGNMSHPTAEAVHALVRADVPTISLRTVYATLHDLAELGEIGELEVGTGSLRFDPNTAPHHHLVCEACHAVFDVEASTPAVGLPDDLAGFQVTGAEIVFRGLCPDCRAVDDAQHPGATRTTPVRQPAPDGTHPSRGDEHPHG